MGAQLAVLVAAGCAKPLPPPGGPVDTTPPRLLRTVPADRAVAQDSARGVTLEFSEPMDHRSVRANTLVSPSAGTLQWEWSGRTARAFFAQPLAPHTTYTLLLPPAFADVKGNRMSAATTVHFATGAALDSGRVSGTVGGRRTRGAGVYVLLRRDSLLAGAAALVDRAQRGLAADGPTAGLSVSDLAEFVTLADPAGAFSFDALPDGRFFIAAWADRNSNRAFDPDRDLLDLSCDPVQVRGGAPVERVQLWVGDEDERPAVSGAVVDSLRLSAAARHDSVTADSLRRGAIWVSLEGDSARRVRADSAGVFRVPDAAPGRYLVRAFRDVDGDSLWTAGREPSSDTVVVCLGWGADVAGVRLAFRAPPAIETPVAPPPDTPPVTPPPARPPKRRGSGPR